jgi:negative regulator of flagellin synthesis FlgM
MVNNINGLNGIQGSASRSREKTQATDSPAGQTSGKETAKVATDQVELSSGARDLQKMESRIRDLPDVNQDRVAHIKDVLREGNYKVDPSRLAAKIAQFELDL